MRMLRVELTRYFSRRTIALLLLAAALFTGLVAAKTIWDTRPATATEMATAQAQSDLAAEQSNLKQELIECRQDPASYLGPNATAAACRSTLVPSAQSLLPRETLSLNQEFNGEGIRIAVLLVGVVVIAAATYIGVDWASDSISTQLTFQPSRSRIWLAKAAVVAIASGLVAAVILLGYWASMLLAADARDITVAGTTVNHISWHLLRAVVLAMAAGLGSYALTMLFRNTVATLALLFAYAAGGEVLINLIPIHGAARWSVGNNVYGWLKDGFQYVDPGIGCRPFTNCDAVRSLGQGDAAWFLAALLLIAVAASFVSFRRRDV